MADTIEVANLVTRLSINDTGVERSMADLTRRMKLAQSEFTAASSKLAALGEKEQEAKVKAEALTKQMDLQAQKIAILKRSFAESAAAKGKDSRETQKIETQLNKAVTQYNRLDSELRSTNNLINEQASRWSKLSNTLETSAARLRSAGQGMTEIGTGLAMALTVPLAAVGGASTKASIDFETAFAGVRKTVDATESEFAKLESGIRGMALEIPAAATEIAKVAEAAGQLGIKKEAIMGFTRTMSDLGVATNMSGDQAATALARLANITQMPQTEFDKLGSTIVALGNNLATTESEIVDMSLRLAGAGAQIGLTEAEILAFAGALSSVGIEAEMGGSAFSRVMVDIAEAAFTGGEQLERFAAVAGMTGEQFRDTFQRNGADALILFVEGLDRISKAGGNAFGILEDLGLSEIRVRDTLLRAAGAGDLFRDSIQLSSQAWRENTALTNEASQRYETTASQLTILWNRLKDAAITLGDALVPALMDTLDALEPVFEAVADGAEWFANLDSGTQKVILAVGALTAAAGPALIMLGQLTQLGANLIGVFGKLAPVIKGNASALLTLSFNPVVLGLAAVAFVGYQVADSFAKAEQATRELKQAQQELQDIQTNGIDRNEIEATQEKIDKLNELIGTYQRLIEIAAASDSAMMGNNVGAMHYAADQLGVKLKEVEKAANEFGIELQFVDKAGKLSAESLEDLNKALGTYSKAIKDARRETASEINDMAKQIAVRNRENENLQELVNTYKSAKQGSDEWNAAQKELARMFPHLAAGTNINITAIEGLLAVKRLEIEAEWESMQTKNKESLATVNAAIKKQEAAIVIANGINKITGSSGLAEAAVSRMNTELERLRGEAANLQGLLGKGPSEIVKAGMGAIPVPKSQAPKTPKTPKAESYQNKALDEAYKLLEHKKRMDQMTLENELKTLEAIKAKHVKTADERMQIEERIYEVRQAIGDASLEKAVKRYEKEKNLGILTENDEIVRLERILKLYADSAEERERIEDMIYDARQRKIETEKAKQSEYIAYTSQQLRAAYEDRLAREEFSAEERYRLEDKLLNDQIWLNQEYLRKVLADSRYTAEEKKQIERQITEEIRQQVNERLELQRDYAAEERKTSIDGINNLSQGLQAALREQYRSEKEAEEGRIKDSISNLENWKRVQLDNIKSVNEYRVKEAERVANAEIEALNKTLNAQIDAIQAELDALDKAQKQKSREELDAEDQKKIDRLRGLIDYEHDEFNKAQLQKELNKVLADQDKRHQEEQLADRKDGLKTEQQQLKEKLKEETDAIKQQLAEKKELLQNEFDAQQANINAIYDAQKAALDRQLIATQNHYNQLLAAKNIQAAAEKMIVQNQQTEILALLEAHGDEYNLVGQTLGEQMYDGFRSQVMQIQGLIDTINNQIASARAAAVSAMSMASAAAAASVVNHNNNSRSVTQTNNFYTPTASPSTVVRATQKAAQALAGY